jgi:hypothetical protein
MSPKITPIFHFNNQILVAYHIEYHVANFNIEQIGSKTDPKNVLRIRKKTLYS